MSFGFESRRKGGKAKKPALNKSAAAAEIPQPKQSPAILSLNELPSDALLREAQLVTSPARPGGIAILPFSAASLHRRIAAGTWIKPLKCGARVAAWQASEVRALRDAHLSGKPESELKALVRDIYAKRQQLAAA